MKKKILLVTTLYSPFQIDLVQAFKQTAESEYHIAFTMLSSSKRGEHWRLSDSIEGEYVHSIDKDGDSDYKVSWVTKLVDDLKPTHVVFGLWRACVTKRVVKVARRKGLKVGYWMEPPNFILPRLVQFGLLQYSKF